MPPRRRNARRTSPSSPRLVQPLEILIVARRFMLRTSLNLVQDLSGAVYLFSKIALSTLMDTRELEDRDECRNKRTQ